MKWSSRGSFIWKSATGWAIGAFRAFGAPAAPPDVSWSVRGAPGPKVVALRARALSHGSLMTWRPTVSPPASLDAGAGRWRVGLAVFVAPRARIGEQASHSRATGTQDRRRRDEHRPPPPRRRPWPFRADQHEIAFQCNGRGPSRSMPGNVAEIARPSAPCTAGPELEAVHACGRGQEATFCPGKSQPSERGSDGYPSIETAAGKAEAGRARGSDVGGGPPAPVAAWRRPRAEPLVARTAREHLRGRGSMNRRLAPVSCTQWGPHDDADRCTSHWPGANARRRRGD